MPSLLLSHLPKCLGSLEVNTFFKDYIALNFSLSRKEVTNLRENKSLVEMYAEI